MFEDVRHKSSLSLLKSLTDPDFLKQSIFTDRERKTIKNLAPEKLDHQRILKEKDAVSLRESYFLFIKKRPIPIWKFFQKC